MHQNTFTIMCMCKEFSYILIVVVFFFVNMLFFFCQHVEVAVLEQLVQAVFEYLFCKIEATLHYWSALFLFFSLYCSIPFRFNIDFRASIITDVFQITYFCDEYLF